MRERPNQIRDGRCAASASPHRPGHAICSVAGCSALVRASPALQPSPTVSPLVGCGRQTAMHPRSGSPRMLGPETVSVSRASLKSLQLCVFWIARVRGPDARGGMPALCGRRRRETGCGGKGESWSRPQAWDNGLDGGPLIHQEEGEACHHRAVHTRPATASGASRGPGHLARLAWACCSSRCGCVGSKAQALGPWRWRQGLSLPPGRAFSRRSNACSARGRRSGMSPPSCRTACTGVSP